MKRPDWDMYFLSIAFLVSQRSIDTSTKCGAVIVSKENIILSTGYNGPIKGSNNEMVPMTRPEKYPYMVHAEENALSFLNCSRQDIQNSTIYITSSPCHKCLRMLLQKGIYNIKFTTQPTVVVNVEDEQIKSDMIKILDSDTMSKLQLIQYQVENVIPVLNNTIEYIKIKNNI